MCAADSRSRAQQSDRQLIEACLQGDADAWEALVLRYQSLVYTIPRRYGLADPDVQDVFQNVFTNLLERLHTVRDHDRLSAWLITVARRECWRITRQQRANPAVNAEDLANEAAPDPLPEEEVERLEEHHLVRRALTALGERCRQILRRLYMDVRKASYAELAQELGIPVGSIGPTRARCLEHLHRLLIDAGWGSRG